MIIVVKIIVCILVLTVTAIASVVIAMFAADLATWIYDKLTFDDTYPTLDPSDENFRLQFRRQPVTFDTIDVLEIELDELNERLEKLESINNKQK